MGACSVLTRIRPRLQTREQLRNEGINESHIWKVQLPRGAVVSFGALAYRLY